MSRRRQRDRRTAPQRRKSAPAIPETPASDAITVAWTVSVTMALACSAGAIGAHVLSGQEIGGKLPLFRDLLLLAGALVGTASLALMPMVYRIRRNAPPRGFAVFAICAAAAPLAGLAIRTLS
ncbi:MAG TPA: hypothetical protein PKC18_20095 [Lacipirellulaceae bacterium]|nr:hypothetical protein [Lacipirellulaceae bacterium]HMP04903.1 hypothetical protein [Lacipirellulaceae bacterium]